MREAGDRKPILSVVFYVTVAGNEPVRDWLLGLSREDRRVVGFDIKTAQYGWPLGMPLIRKLEPGLLHGFVKKSEKTPVTDLKTARQRMADLQER